MMRKSRGLAAVAAVLALLATTACSENSGRGAVLGAATGAGLGVLGHGGILGNTAKGAAVGGLGGYVYDNVKNWD